MIKLKLWIFKLWELWNFSQKKNKKTCYIMMKEYYEIWVGKIIALNGEKNEKKNTSLHVKGKKLENQTTLLFTSSRT